MSQTLKLTWNKWPTRSSISWKKEEEGKERTNRKHNDKEENMRRENK